MSGAGERWNIVVLDDRKEFAIHVWRYLDRSLGIGTRPEDGSGEDWMPEQRILPLLNGMNQFCWLHADSHWQEKLAPFVEAIDKGWNLFAVIDVVGEKGSLYDPEKVISHLAQTGRSHSGKPGQIDSVVVSAYHVGAPIHDEVEVRPKSRATLKEIRQRLDLGKGSAPEAPRARHILVTGAGFELRNPRGGFGMLPTYRIMEVMRHPFQLLADGQQADDAKRDVIFLERGKGLPRPRGKDWDGIVSLRNAAEENQLDRYWDILLAEDLRRTLGEFSSMETYEREAVAARALLGERNKREAFRASIREHDWGHLNQSLDAAGLRWHAWLTTNYTRFADRAIALVDPSSWRIISTAAEANTAVREDNWQLNIRHRYLFKLHGDVGHLHTMAIAGHDKDTLSPLSVPIDDLHQIYASAERFLRFSLKAPAELVVWHIVGHALGDHRLIGLIGDAYDLQKGQHLFLIANPKPDLPFGSLDSHLSKLGGDRYRIEKRSLLAAEYMARLACSGLPATAEKDDLVGWFRSLPSGEEELKG